MMVISGAPWTFQQMFCLTPLCILPHSPPYHTCTCISPHSSLICHLYPLGGLVAAWWCCFLWSAGQCHVLCRYSCMSHSVPSIETLENISYHIFGMRCWSGHQKCILANLTPNIALTSTRWSTLTHRIWSITPRPHIMGLTSGHFFKYCTGQQQQTNVIFNIYHLNIQCWY